MSRNLLFVDLTHTGKVIDANYIPLAIGYIAAYALDHLKGEISPTLFKYPNRLSEYLNCHTPDVACFTNYMWNERLQSEYAQRIKARNPKVVTVFGGPNYPINEVEQFDFLKQHPDIDFYVEGEGERAFVDLFRALDQVEFNHVKLKAKARAIPNVHYLLEDRLVKGELAPRMLDLDDCFPSPYLNGLLDEFFDDKLQPLMQTSRGCPYACTFCHDGLDYMNKTRTFSQDRIRGELDYIADRVKVPGLTLADLNWGMFPGDIETAKVLAGFQKERGWPTSINTATAKNQKDRIVDMSRILGDSFKVGAAVQSTDPDVLEIIKRKNIGFDAITKMAKESARANSTTFSEIILCLPGDTKQKHFKSVFDMLDAGLQDIRTYQFILLPGTEGGSLESRREFGYETRFRVLPRCFGEYRILNNDVFVSELHEVCVANKTMPFEDYLECRDLSLTLAVFNNGNAFEEVLALADAFKIPRSRVMKRIHELAENSSGSIAKLYEDYRSDESRNFWEHREDLEAFLATPEGVNAYLSGENGGNQIYRYRTLAFEKLEEISQLPIEAVRLELQREGIFDSMLSLYLEELKSVIVKRKSNTTELQEEYVLESHFDFVTLDSVRYQMDPRRVYSENRISHTLSYSDEQKRTLNSFYRQYGKTTDGIGYLVHRNDARIMYRELKYTDKPSGRHAQPSVDKSFSR